MRDGRSRAMYRIPYPGFTCCRDKVNCVHLARTSLFPSAFGVKPKSTQFTVNVGAGEGRMFSIMSHEVRLGSHSEVSFY
jgi:hypothetical protein